MDYANTQHAAANRLAKARQIAAWCWDHGLTWEHLEYATDPEWARLSRTAAGRVSSDKTRLLAQAHLLIKEAWAAANPNHPEAARAIATPEQVAALTKGARRR